MGLKKEDLNIYYFLLISKYIPDLYNKRYAMSS